ncbi:MAG: trigger factor [bacterium]|nr:trigger factor [bacterium]
MKKKIVLLTLTAVLSCSMLACSSKKDDKGNADANATASPSATANIDEVKVLSADLTGYVKLGQYKGLTIEEVSDTVTDKQVEEQIEATLKEKATWDAQDAKYKAKNLDQVNMDYVGKIDGKEFDGGSAKATDLQIGSNQFIEGFEAGLIGHKKGDKFDLKLKFPENYGNADLAGKDAVFTVTINSISKQNVPKLTDKYVKDTLSKTSKTVAEYKKEVRKTLEMQATESKVQGEAKNAIQAAIAKAEITEYPQDQMDYYKSLVTSYYTNIAKYYYGMALADFITANNYTTETWDSEVVTKSAQDMLKQVMVVQAIAKAENISVTDEEYKNKLPDYLASYQVADEEALKTSYGEGATLSIKDELLYNKVGAFLVKNDKVEKVVATATPAPTATAATK